MNEQTIIKKIQSIMKNRLNIKFDEKKDQIEHQNFFGNAYNLVPFELAYLLMEVEREFNIIIPESYIIDPGVKTIYDFVRYILDCQVRNTQE